MSFWKNSKSTELRKAMARLINTSFSLQDEHPELDDQSDLRSETRSKRLMPVAIITDEQGKASIVIGFSKDLSLDGMAIVTNQEVNSDDLIVVLGTSPECVAVCAQRVNSRPLGLGCFQSGLKFTKLIGGSDAAALLQVIADFEGTQLASPSS